MQTSRYTEAQIIAMLRRASCAGWPSSDRVLPKMMFDTSCPLGQQVSLADRTGFPVQLLPEHDPLDLVVMLGQVVARDRQHAASASGGVMDRAHHAGLGQHIVILDEQQVDHEADHLTRGFRKAADQVFKGQAHLVVAAQHGQRQDDLAIVGLLVIPAQQVGDRPQEQGQALPVQTFGRQCVPGHLRPDQGRMTIH